MPEILFQTRGLRKEYFEVLAVEDLDLSIPAGEIFGLIGPNGAGKTTLLRMLATTLEATSGEALFQGRDIWQDPISVRKNLGFMPDFFQMYEKLKVWELLKYFGIAHGLDKGTLDGRIDEVLDMIDLRRQRDMFCRGLSRGMMQRLGVGRAILHKPKALLLDEPASGLDPLARRDLFELLRRVHAEGATIVISSHILDELTGLCTSVGIMLKGRLVTVGPVGEILRTIMPSRQIALRLAGSAGMAAGLLAKEPLVSNLQSDGDEVRFQFSGDNAQLAELNARLFSAGAAIALCQESRTTLHEIYFAVAGGHENVGSD